MKNHILQMTLCHFATLPFGVSTSHFTSNFFVHSKIFIIFAHNILKPIMRRTYHSDLSQAITKMPPQFLRALRQKEVGATNVFASLR